MVSLGNLADLLELVDELPVVLDARVEKEALQADLLRPFKPIF